MKKKYFIAAILVVSAMLVQAQSFISGHFPGNALHPVSLSVYKGFDRTQVSTTTTDSLGNFRLFYPSGYRGVAFVQVNNADGIEVVVTKDGNFSIKGSSLTNINDIACSGNETTATLYGYYREQIAREKALAGWRYLQKVYTNDPYLLTYQKTESINNEIRSLARESDFFIKTQPENSYLRWYLPLVTFVRDIPVSIQQYPERIPQHIDFFMHTDFSDNRFYSSGLLPLLMETYYFMLENSGRSLDSMYVEVNRATDYVLSSIRDKKPDLLQATSLFLFKLFEKRSMFAASEHVSLFMLTQNSCVLDGKVSARFEGYRAMKKGNLAPDIDFTKATTQKEQKGSSTNKYLKGYSSLSAINSKYKLVVFGFADCGECRVQLPQLKQMYSDLKKRNMEVIYVSLDTDKKSFETTAADSPWISYFDYKGWDSPVAAGYHVFASPTIYLLGQNQEILYKIINPQHLEAVLKTLK